MSASSDAMSPLRGMVPGAHPFDQQLGAGADEAVHPEDHARGVERQQAGEHVGGDEGTVGLDVDTSGQHHLAERAAVDEVEGVGHDRLPVVMVHHRGEQELARSPARLDPTEQGRVAHLVGQSGGRIRLGGASRLDDRHPGIVAAAADDDLGDDQGPGRAG
jgi:hypothetical protein